MSELSVERLLAADFELVGCWGVNVTGDLALDIDLPHRAGVYAFAIDGLVQYVGLASKSVRQRLGFYCRPGATQRTNIRLNETIRERIGEGATIQILIGHPPDNEWNGLPIMGSEGLEAGLIAQFDLPWNMRGTRSKKIAAAVPYPAPRSGSGSLAERIVERVHLRPGMTELEIARELFGPRAIQQNVNHVCRRLTHLGLIERRGSGGRGDPYVYY